MKLKSIAVGLVALVATGPTGLVRAETIGGPCNGESSPSRRIEAHVVGREIHEAAKVVVQVRTDNASEVTGKLVFERADARVSVESWCRLWGGDDGDSGHTGVVHVLGIEILDDGTQRYIRVDLSQEDGGRVRLMTRAMTHGGHGVSADSEQGWRSMMGDGWVRLTRLRIGSSR